MNAPKAVHISSKSAGLPSLPSQKRAVKSATGSREPPPNDAIQSSSGSRNIPGWPGGHVER